MKSDRIDRAERLVKELNWARDAKNRRLYKILKTWIFSHPARGRFASSLKKQRILDILLRELNSDYRIFDCPSGSGKDFEILKQISSNVSIVGIDISEERLHVSRLRNNTIPVCCADILKLPVKEEVFDCVFCKDFLHHVLEDGFDGYLQEFKRVLKPHGILIIVELNILYFTNWIFLPLRKLFYNAIGYDITGQVPHERAFLPSKLIKALKRVGYSEIKIEACEYVHNRFYLPISRLVSVATRFLQRTWLKRFAISIIYIVKR